MRSTVMSSPGRAVTVSRYAKGERQARHADRNSRISLVLRGGFWEESDPGVVRMGAGEVLLKSCKVEHEDVFGNQGADLLSIEFHGDDPLGAGAPVWRKLDDPGAMRLAVNLLEAALARDDFGVDAVGADLLATSATPEGRRSGSPSWLSQLREELEASGLARVDVASRARAAGVHAAHASRLFRRHFASSITEHAQGHAVRRAVAMMAKPDVALSEIAIAAGFYDQSHMNRVFLRVAGRSPGAYRSLTARALAMGG